MLIDFETNSRDACLYFIKSLIQEKLEFLKSLSDEKVNFLFPVKSFPHNTILELASKYAIGFDVSNINEFNLIQEYLNSNSVVWSSAPYFIDDLSSSCETYIDLNSLDLIDQIQDKSKVSLRLNTDFVRDESRFGLKTDEIVKILKSNKDIKAIHAHLSGVDNIIEDYFEILKEFKLISDEVKRPLVFNFGGGFSPISQDSIKGFVDVVKKELAEHKVLIEPGRWVARGAGFALGKILNINKKFVTLSLSPSCHLKWIEPKVNLSLVAKKDLEKKDEIMFSGPTCYENDLICSIQSDLSQLSIGDKVLIDNVSGYCVAWNHSFNGISQADVVFIN